MNEPAEEKSDRPTTQTGGRAATVGQIGGDCVLAVGMPVEAPPPGWHWRLLTDLSRLETGHTPSRRHPEYWNGAIPWIGIRDATSNHGRTLLDTEQHVTQAGIDNSSARLLPTNTVCLSRTASLGYVVVMGRPMATSQDFVNWVCDPELLDFRYLKYALLAERTSYSRFAHGTTHQTIYFPEVKAFHICAPSRGTQAAIANVLTALDDKIEQNRRTAQALERLARAIFRAWFVDFEPVKAKAEGAAAFPSMPQPVFDALPTRFVDSPIGPVPEGWGIKALYDTAQYINGAAFRSEHFCDPSEGVPVVKIAELKSGITSQTKFSNRSDLDVKYQIDTGEVLYSWSGSPDTSLDTFLWTKGKGLLNQHIFRVMTTNAPQKNFVYYLLKHLRQQLIEIARDKQTTGLGHVTVSDMRRLKVCWPAPRVFEGFARMVGPIFEASFSLMMESEKLAEMRDYLLPKLLSGQVPVSVDERNLRKKT